MLVEKKALSPEVLEAQTAMELPDREMMALINVVVFDVVDIRNVDVAANVCVNQAGILVQGDPTAAQTCRANA